MSINHIIDWYKEEGDVYQKIALYAKNVLSLMIEIDIRPQPIITTLVMANQAYQSIHHPFIDLIE